MTTGSEGLPDINRTKSQLEAGLEEANRSLDALQEASLTNRRAAAQVQNISTAASDAAGALEEAKNHATEALGMTETVMKSIDAVATKIVGAASVLGSAALSASFTSGYDRDIKELSSVIKSDVDDMRGNISVAAGHATLAKGYFAAAYPENEDPTLTAAKFSDQTDRTVLTANVAAGQAGTLRKIADNTDPETAHNRLSPLVDELSALNAQLAHIRTAAEEIRSRINGASLDMSAEISKHMRTKDSADEVLEKLGGKMEEDIHEAIDLGDSAVNSAETKLNEL